MQHVGVFPACLVVWPVEGVVVWLNRLKQASDCLTGPSHSDQSHGCKHGHMTPTAGLLHKVGGGRTVEPTVFPTMHLEPTPSTYL